MKRAPRKPAMAAQARLCNRPGCGNVLARRQKRFCSHSCRGKVCSLGNNGGAPERYRPEFARQIAFEYLDWCEKKNNPTLIPTRNSYIVLKNAHLPTMEDYCAYLAARGYGRVSVQTLYNWGDKYIAFAQALDLLKMSQKTFLINYGLAGRYNARLAMLQLRVNHGQIERKEIEVPGGKLVGILKTLNPTDGQGWLS